MKPQRYYFAYGSNMLAEQMHLRCHDAQRVGAAKLQGYRFLINQRGVATIRKDAEAICRGGVWKISPSDEWFLDQYEGVDAGNYRKVLIGVRLRNGQTVAALTYIDRRIRHGIPREGYLERVVCGARQFGLPPGYVETLQLWGSCESRMQA